MYRGRVNRCRKVGIDRTNKDHSSKVKQIESERRNWDPSKYIKYSILRRGIVLPCDIDTVADDRFSRPTGFLLKIIKKTKIAFPLVRAVEMLRNENTEAGSLSMMMMKRYGNIRCWTVNHDVRGDNAIENKNKNKNKWRDERRREKVRERVITALKI